MSTVGGVVTWTEQVATYRQKQGPFPLAHTSHQPNVTVNHLWERLSRLQTDTVRSAIRPLYHRVAYSKHLSHIWIKHRHIISASVTALQFYLLGFRLPSGSVFVFLSLSLSLLWRSNSVFNERQVNE